MIQSPECANLHPDKQSFKDTLSPTSLDQLLGCEEKWRLSRVERLDPAVKSVPLEMGAAFAEATEHADPDRGFRRYLVEWDYAHRTHGTNPWAIVPSAEQAEVNATIISAAAKAYLTRYGQTELREQTYRVPIRGGGHDLLCRVDGVEDGGRTLVEDKFVSRIDRGTIDRRLKLDRQVSIEFYTHWRVTGILAERMRYRMTLKCGLRRGRRESHDQFLDRIAKDYEERPDFYLVEFDDVTRTLRDFVRLEHDLSAWSMRLVFLRASNAWTRNTARCSDFAGCEYLPLCSHEPGAINQFRERQRAQPQEEAAT